MDECTFVHEPQTVFGHATTINSLELAEISLGLREAGRSARVFDTYRYVQCYP